MGSQDPRPQDPPIRRRSSTAGKLPNFQE
ncbi:MAG TPA: hypothetical protein ENI07_03595 [Desulfobacterales bacterium]|nr:hypothetical protein [Desulfobacterales bacterium]